MDLEHAKTILTHLYADVDGYAISAQARKKLSYEDKAHTYGEITPDAFYKILQDVEPMEGEKFYDLGSGTGKAVILAHLLFDFVNCRGIEILEELNNTAQTVLARFILEYRQTLPEKKQTQLISFIHGDIMNENFLDGNVFFTHATCFYDELWVRMIRRLEYLKKGARVIVVTRTLDSPSFQLVRKGEYSLSWGQATVNSYVKIV